MQNIVELKVEETKAVVGGLKASRPSRYGESGVLGKGKAQGK
jgi:hypothetical protein